MAMVPSWESLSETISEMQNRLRDLETARKVFALRSETDAGILTFNDTGELPLNVWVGSDPLNGASVGPDLLEIPVYSGSMLVVVSAEIKVGPGPSNASAYFSWTLDGPSPLVEDTNRALACNWQTNMTGANTITASYARLHTGLEEGTYNIYPKYRCDSLGTAPRSGATVKNRHILAVPF